MLEVISGSHFVADLTLGYGEVVFDYLDEPGGFDRRSELFQSQNTTHRHWENGFTNTLSREKAQ